jgi:type II secretory pathway pseudopilin PulG
MHATTPQDRSNGTNRRGRPAGARARGRAFRAGFSLTELLVVIGIIVLLIGLLLVALAVVRKRSLRTETEARMRQFANACATFQSEHGRYPGVIPEEVLAATPEDQLPVLTSTENALLHLMGGNRVLTPSDPPNGPAPTAYADYLAKANATGTDQEFTLGVTPNEWQLIVDLRKIGEGPVIDGKSYAPYFTPGPNDLVVCKYPHEDAEPDPTNQVPDLVDAWGQPIIYLKQWRNRGPLVEDIAGTNAPAPQFNTVGADPYLDSTKLGELEQNQAGGNAMSILHLGNDEMEANTWSLLLAHPAFYRANSVLYGQSKGAFVLMSAGPDGIYFSAVDGPGSDAVPIDDTNINALLFQPGPRILEEKTDGFDDIRIFGGG